MKMTKILKVVTAFTVIASIVGLSNGAKAETVLRAVMHSDLKVLDPIWTTAYISRDHGYMIYDTLFSLDERFRVQPQMVEKYTVSADKLTYTFVLRDGLTFHDGARVTSDDVIASLTRWGQRDQLGLRLFRAVKELVAADPKTIRLVLKEPYGHVLTSLAKPTVNVPFIMPKHVATKPPTEQISDFTGSGPFIFKKEEWRPGSKVVYVKNRNYVPRQEPPSWASGGKVAKVDRVEWVAIPDAQTAVNALIAGEIDYIEQVPHDLLPILQPAKNIELTTLNPLGSMYYFRFNFLHPPFDNQKIRQAALVALNQEDFLKAAIGDPKYYRVCKTMLICGSPFATTKGTENILSSNYELSKKLLKEAGYGGTPVVLLHSPDVSILANLPPVAASLLRKGGFNVDMQSMDWQTLITRRAKKDPPSKGGWSAFMSASVASEVMNPLGWAQLSGACDKAFFGWPCDERIESLRDAFSKETDPAKQKALAEEIQVRALEFGLVANLGEYTQPSAYRKDRLEGLLSGPSPFLWNISKKSN